MASKRPRLQYEVRPFTRESLEKINIRTSNLIREEDRCKQDWVDGMEVGGKKCKQDGSGQYRVFESVEDNAAQE